MIVNVSTGGSNGLMPIAAATVQLVLLPRPNPLKDEYELRNTGDWGEVWGISHPEFGGFVRSRRRLRIVMKLGVTESRHPGFKRPPFPTGLLPSGPNAFP